ncbi:MAG: macro domain-containing protein, partial [Bacteroidota bacterium]
HTVGPVWGVGDRNEELLLASCYRKSLAQATVHDCKTIAFPNISTGVYHFPKELAAKIAIREVKSYLTGNAIPEKVIFACYDEENFAIYQELLSQ